MHSRPLFNNFVVNNPVERSVCDNKVVVNKLVESLRETERAWKVTWEDVKAGGHNLDIKNPHTAEEGLGHPRELLEKLSEGDADALNLRDQLKTALAEALLR